SVFMQFYIKKQQRRGLRNKFLNLVLPFISVCAILCLWFNLDHSSLIFGCIWLLAGISVFFYKKFKKQNIAISNVY
ncbi:MAG TPA: putrescine/spermidine ABC transporter, partial [Acinetobacter radioresistens]|nr:putrescine/spermidine ABC transporter [Acinetobacter radioresistens]